jgi:uncharacterized protein YhhL (DUF1145 family)
MVLAAKVVTALAWLAIIVNWVTPINGFYDILHWTGIGLGAAHLIEAFVFLPKAKQAGGSVPLHFLQLFIFGYAHVMGLDEAARKK